MSNKKSRYRFVSSPFFLGLYSLTLLATSLILSMGIYSPPRDAQISVLTGFLEVQHLSTTISFLLTLAVTGATASIIYLLNSRYFNTGKHSMSLVFLYLIFLFSTPQTVFFSGSIVAAPLFLLSLYYTIDSGNKTVSIFSSGILISVATLFDFHLLPLILFIAYYSLVKSSFSFRSLVLFLSAVVLPYLFIFSIRYIVFEDATLFAQIIWSSNISSMSFPHLNIDTVADICLIFFSLFIAYRAIYSILNKVSSYKIIKAMALIRLIVIAFVFAIIILLNREVQAEFMTLLAIPISFIINEYLTNKNTNQTKRGEFLVFLIILALTRVAEFM